MTVTDHKTGEFKMYKRISLLGAAFISLFIMILLIAAGTVTAQDATEDAASAVESATAAEAAPAAPKERIAPIAYSGKSPSKVIFPEQTIPFRFFHDKHLKMGLPCTMCHIAAEESEKSSDNLLPHLDPDADKADHEIACKSCHMIGAPDAANLTPPASCDVCHPGFDESKGGDPAKIVIPSPNLKNNHMKHVDENDIECQVCHGDMLDVQLATRDNLPTMDKCLECHDGHTKVGDVIPPANCDNCHITGPNGKLKLDFGSKVPTQAGNWASGTNDGEKNVLRPGNRRSFSHDNDWKTTHRTLAEAEPALCKNCHETSWCADCHNGAVRPQVIHPNDWVTTHPRQAKSAALNCSACHDYEQFCKDCHNDHRVSPKSKPNSVNFHADGWLTVGPKHHSRVARRNLNYCAACHENENPTCLTCHSARQGIKRSPHPTGFKSIADGNKLPEAVCLKCHSTDTAKDSSKWE